MSSPDSIYYNNLITLPENQYKNVKVQRKISPSVFHEGYDGYGGRYTDESVTKIVYLGKETPMGKLGFDKFELTNIKSYYRINPQDKIFLEIYKNGKSFFLKKGENILKQLVKML